jgi:hypothetical protein
MAMTETDAHNELQAYTLSHGNVAFIHQHVVDAWGAQHAQPSDKPLRLFFSLVGLFLKIERGFTGRQVQNAHRELARQKRMSAPLTFPAGNGTMTVIDVMGHPPGEERDRAIDQWCESVWNAWRGNRETVQAILIEAGIIKPA